MLIINDKANNCYYFVAKNLSELNSLGWLIGKKEAIINNDNSFQNDLDDALNYQTIKINPERISKLKPYINITALNILFIPHNTKIISVAYRSEYNHKRKKQVILLMIPNRKKSHYLAVTNLSAFLAKKSSNHDGDFYCLNSFNSYKSKIKLKEREQICKSLKAPFAIYLDLECLLKKEQSCENNPEISYTEKKAKHEPSVWAIFTK